jgi:D-alanyl-D-alanine carboxypeptidase/D-alanyl-D-alanine-endopeptidase (penicillin-binding protein 4)
MSRSDLWPEFWRSLPEAGNRLELPRMYRTPAAANLRAKTGTIRGVSALSGVVQSSDGERLAFSVLVNGASSTSVAKRIENNIGIRLASFTRGVDAGLPLSASATGSN